MLKNIIENVEKYPNKKIITIDKKSITYNELYLNSLIISEQIQKHGIEENDKVILLLPISFELYYCILGLFNIGATIIFIEPRIIQKLETIEAKAIISNYQIQILKYFNSNFKLFYEKIPLKFIFSPITFKNEIKLSTAKLNSNKAEKIKPENAKTFEKYSNNIAIISYTSGTTGTPKGVIRTYKTLFKQGEYLYNSMKLNQEDIDFTNLPLFTLKNLYYGISSYVNYIKNWKKLNLKEISNKLTKCTSITASVGLINQIVDYNLKINRTFENIRIVYTGGAPCYNKFLKKIKKVFTKAEIEVLYGSTEAEPISHINLSKLEYINDSEGICVGKPIPQIDIKIINPINNVYNISNVTVGEIAVNGEHTADNYTPPYQNQNKTLIESKQYHLTGDIGYFDTQNNLWLLGRKQQKIQINEKIIFPLQIEKIVDNLPEIQKSAFIRVNNKNIIIIKTQSNSEKEKLENKIKSLIEEKFKDLKIYKVIKVSEIPFEKRHNSKIDYTKLEKYIKKSKI